jgi:hypothetical protein
MPCHGRGLRAGSMSPFRSANRPHYRPIACIIHLESLQSPNSLRRRPTHGGGDVPPLHLDDQPLDPPIPADLRAASPGAALFGGGSRHRWRFPPFTPSRRGWCPPPPLAFPCESRALRLFFSELPSGPNRGNGPAPSFREGNIGGDPLLAEPEARDLHLLPGNLALDAGLRFDFLRCSVRRPGSTPLPPLGLPPRRSRRRPAASHDACAGRSTYNGPVRSTEPRCAGRRRSEGVGDARPLRTRGQPQLFFTRPGGCLRFAAYLRRAVPSELHLRRPSG